MCIFYSGLHELYVDYISGHFLVDPCHAACCFVGESGRRVVSLFVAFAATYSL